MTKKEIVKMISERSGLTQLKTKEIVQWTFDAISDTLSTDGRIELRNFGVFEVRERKARKARNPRTGAAVEVQSKKVVTFQPGKEMEEKVQGAKAAKGRRKPGKPMPANDEESLVGAIPVGAGMAFDDGDLMDSYAESAAPMKPR
ncbi:MAG: HU family DNA-binding protein [Gemmataceae bacterium]